MENRSALVEASKYADRLPTLPGIALKLLAAFESGAPDLNEIVAILSADPPLTAKVLRMANSSFFGLAGEVTSLRRAAVLLGLNTIKNLALSFSLISRFRSARHSSQYADFWKDALIGAIAAKWTSDRLGMRNGENLFFMGLLQDIGRLALMESDPQAYQRVLEDAAQGSDSDHVSERRHLGVDHLELGEYVMRSWGLPDSFATPIRFHHFPEGLNGDTPDLTALTRVLHVSTLMIGFFKTPGSSDIAGLLKRSIRAYGMERVLDPAELVAQIAAGAESLFPVFDLEVDEQKNLAIVEAARDSLACLANELLAELKGQACKIQTLTTEADSDGLTRLHNQRKFRTVLKEEIRSADRMGTPLALILVDIDHFKSVNDTFGHLAGDHALSSAAGWIKNQLRSCDHAARYGGEEFALILPRVDLESAVKVAERLRKGIAGLKMTHHDRKFGITISCGVAAYDHQRENADVNLIHRADQALYQAKRAGRNQSRGYRPDWTES